MTLMLSTMEGLKRIIKIISPRTQVQIRRAQQIIMEIMIINQYFWMFKI